MLSGHAVYQGEVGHLRLLPRQHRFAYQVALYYLDTAKLNASALASVGIGYEQFAALSYRRRDYLPGADRLYQAVCDKVAELGGTIAPAQVFVLTPLANWGLYFSPLTLYYCYDAAGDFCYLLAEVSNTPWNERHYYLQSIVSGQTKYQHAKAFHVSPFNPIDMQYHWQIMPPGPQLRLSIANHRAGKQIFSAWMNFERKNLTLSWRRHWLIRHPWQNVKVVLRIYWHALKLLIKGVPVHAHPKTKDNNA